MKHLVRSICLASYYPHVVACQECSSNMKGSRILRKVEKTLSDLDVRYNSWKRSLFSLILLSEMKVKDISSIALILENSTSVFNSRWLQKLTSCHTPAHAVCYYYPGYLEVCPQQRAGKSIATDFMQLSSHPRTKTLS